MRGRGGRVTLQLVLHRGGTSDYTPSYTGDIIPTLGRTSCRPAVNTPGWIEILLQEIDHAGGVLTISMWKD